MSDNPSWTTMSSPLCLTNHYVRPTVHDKPFARHYVRQTICPTHVCMGKPLRPTNHYGRPIVHCPPLYPTHCVRQPLCTVNHYIRHFVFDKPSCPMSNHGGHIAFHKLCQTKCSFRHNVRNTHPFIQRIKRELLNN